MAKLETRNGIPAFHARKRNEWRKWLEKNGQSEKAVLLIRYHKGSNTSSLPYPEAVEEALCFGWIDGRANKRDEESFYLLFTPRKPKGNWSSINKARVAEMIKKGLMTERGQAVIDLAKKTGAWDASNDVENLVIPEDLQKLFARNKTARKNFEAFPPSSKKIILGWIMQAKKPETRQQRITQTVALAAENIKANHR